MTFVYLAILILGIVIGWHLREKYVCLHPEWEETGKCNVVSSGYRNPIGEIRYLRCKKCGTVKHKKLMT